MYSWVDLLIIGGIVLVMWLALRGDASDGDGQADAEEVDVNLHDREHANEILNLADQLERMRLGREGGRVNVTVHGSPSDCSRLDYITQANAAWLMRDGGDDIRVRFTEREREGEPFGGVNELPQPACGEQASRRR
jgi:hypothetical protein